jgi:DNA-nicking Smr family endonuclease
LDRDKQAFHDAMVDVKPMTPPNRTNSRGPVVPAVPLQTKKDERAVIRELDDPFTGHELPIDLETGEELLFSKSGVSGKAFRRLRRGYYSVEDTLDLHHMDTHTARTCLADFIERSRFRGHGCIRIIHGKGR